MRIRQVKLFFKQDHSIVYVMLLEEEETYRKDPVIYDEITSSSPDY